MKHCAEYEKKEKCIAVSCGTQPFKKNIVRPFLLSWNKIHQ